MKHAWHVGEYVGYPRMDNARAYLLGMVMAVHLHGPEPMYTVRGESTDFYFAEHDLCHAIQTFHGIVFWRDIKEAT